MVSTTKDVKFGCKTGDIVSKEGCNNEIQTFDLADASPYGNTTNWLDTKISKIDVDVYVENVRPGRLTAVRVYAGVNTKNLWYITDVYVWDGKHTVKSFTIPLNKCHFRYLVFKDMAYLQGAKRRITNIFGTAHITYVQKALTIAKIDFKNSKFYHDANGTPFTAGRDAHISDLSVKNVGTKWGYIHINFYLYPGTDKEIIIRKESIRVPGGNSIDRHPTIKLPSITGIIPIGVKVWGEDEKEPSWK